MPQEAPRRLVPVSEPGKRHRRSLHTVSLIAASLAGAAQFAGAQADAGPERINYEADGIRMAALRAGDTDGVRVIFIHGTPGSAGAWDDYLADVPSGFEYIAVDRPGFGESGPDNAVTSLERQARAIEPLLEGESVILVGHSLGGPIAAMLAVMWPDRVHGAVIAAGSLDPSLEDIHFMQPVGEWWGVRHVLPRSIRNSNRELMALEPELNALAARLDRITAPVEIVHGTADNLVPFENVAFMEREMSGAALTVTVLDGQNHFLPWNSRADIEAAIGRIAAGQATGDTR